jgi:hypothetical protein
MCRRSDDRRILDVPFRDDREEAVPVAVDSLLDVRLHDMRGT